jgi:hypothetical protein
MLAFIENEGLAPSGIWRCIVGPADLYVSKHRTAFFRVNTPHHIYTTLFPWGYNFVLYERENGGTMNL